MRSHYKQYITLFIIILNSPFVVTIIIHGLEVFVSYFGLYYAGGLRVSNRIISNHDALQLNQAYLIVVSMPAYK